MEGMLRLRMENRSTGLYYIKDVVSDVRVSGYMEFPTEAHACMSFCGFIQNQKEQQHIDNIDCYQLICAARVDQDDSLHSIGDMICDGSDCVEMRDRYIDAYRHLNGELS